VSKKLAELLSNGTGWEIKTTEHKGWSAYRTFKIAGTKALLEIPIENWRVERIQELKRGQFSDLVRPDLERLKDLLDSHLTNLPQYPQAQITVEKTQSGPRTLNT